MIEEKIPFNCPSPIVSLVNTNVMSETTYDISDA